jgi:Ran GTPase-activating protein (RanGAP) involved in mRNA processing and transport
LFLSTVLQVPDLEELDLSGNNIGIEGAKVLAGPGHTGGVLRGCPRLRRLDLHRNRIGAEGGAALAEALCRGACRRLEHLYIECNGLPSDSGRGGAGAGFDDVMERLGVSGPHGLQVNCFSRCFRRTPQLTLN